MLLNQRNYLGGLEHGTFRRGGGLPSGFGGLSSGFGGLPSGFGGLFSYRQHKLPEPVKETIAEMEPEKIPSRIKKVDVDGNEVKTDDEKKNPSLGKTGRNGNKPLEVLNENKPLAIVKKPVEVVNLNDNDDGKTDDKEILTLDSLDPNELDDFAPGDYVEINPNKSESVFSFNPPTKEDMERFETARNKLKMGGYVFSYKSADGAEVISRTKGGLIRASGVKNAKKLFPNIKDSKPGVEYKVKDGYYKYEFLTSI